MNIGIIGAGNIGGALAKKLTALGHHVKIANSRGPDTLAAVAKETGAHAVTFADAARGVELVIVTIPQKNITALPKDLFPSDITVADTGNYYPFRDSQIAPLDDGSLTETGWVAQHFGRPVLKVFNNITTKSLVEGGLPKGAPNRIALPIAGDDENGKKTLFSLVDALGFDPIDGGSLAESWRQQPGSPGYCTDLPAARAKRALAEAERAVLPARRDEMVREMMAHMATISHAELIEAARRIARSPA